MEIEPVVSVDENSIYPLIFTPETIQKFWDKARQFPTIYGKEAVNNFDEFIGNFFARSPNGSLVPYGLFWVMNDFDGVFYLTEIRQEGDNLIDAHAHYTFFDRRHHGRVPLVKEMLKFWFRKYEFQRLSAEIPNFATSQARVFASKCGMQLEGKRREAAHYKQTWFDINLYGILRREVLKWDQPLVQSETQSETLPEQSSIIHLQVES